MKAKTLIKKRTGTRLSQRVRAKISQPVSIHRRSPSGFSCGIDLERAILVEESLDERERRG
jgi:hypothetical protein